VRLLFVTPFVPAANAGHAGGVTMYHFVEGLARRGHEVHLLSLCRDAEQPDLDALRDGLASVRFLRIPHRHARSALARLRHHARIAAALAGGLFSRSPAYLLRYRYRAFERLVASAIAELRPELVQLEYLQMAPLVRHVPPGVPVVLDTHEVQSLAALRALLAARPPLWQLHALELASWIDMQARLEGFARILTVSDADRLALEALAPHLPAETLPQGLDCSRFRPQAGPREPESLVFVGSFDHHQNLDAARCLIEEVFPAVAARRPAARLHVVGSHPPAWLQRSAGSSIAVPGFVEDLPGYVGRREVFVAPLRQGAGIKIKLLQAMALGLPVVTTPAGAEGIGLRDGVDALVAPDVEGCAERCVRLLEDPDLAARLGQAGRALALARFDAPGLVERLEAVHREVLAEAAAQRAQISPL
jgi:polysaccharide biosynthesis protein PslH